MYRNDYIVHGELEISRLDRKGQLIWQFTGSDIFTTPNGHDTFEIGQTTIKAKNWEETIYELEIETGKLIRTY
jgi:hypothetical protein